MQTGSLLQASDQHGGLAGVHEQLVVQRMLALADERLMLWSGKTMVAVKAGGSQLAAARVVLKQEGTIGDEYRGNRRSCR